jgi:hypothetical protein
MKFKNYFAIFMILTVSGLSNPAFGQGRGFVSWRDATKEPISGLIITFGKVADLNYTEDDSLEFGLTEKRENLTGMELFKKSFVLPKEAADSSLYRMDRIVNFIDTAYIRMYQEIENCTDDRMKDSLVKRFNSDKQVNKYISIDDYIGKIKKIYNRNDINDQILPGIATGVATDQINFEGKMSEIEIADKRHKLSANRWMTSVSAKFDFLGYYLNSNNEPLHIDFKARLIFEVSFDEIKKTDGKAYANYKIEKVMLPISPKDIIDIWPTYLFTLQPFLSGGYRTITSSIPASRIDEAFHLNDAIACEAGILFERKMKPFSNQFIDMTVATGVTLTQFIVNSYMTDNYNDESSENLSPPFVTSEYLTHYSIQSVFEDVSYHDVQMFVGVPVKLGFGFKLDANDNVRGYLRSAITYNFPVSSKTNADGMVDQKGKFMYKVNMDGVIQDTEVLIGGEGNPLPEYYGKNNVSSAEPIQWKNGLVSKTEFDVSMRFKRHRNTYLELGPYFSLGSYQLKNPPLEFLALEGGKVYSPLSAMDKRVSFYGYGITLSVSFDIKK